MKKIGIILLAFTCQLVKGQEKQGLGIGDKVPDIVFNQPLNTSKHSISTAMLKDRLVVLDFWATWCSSCIAHFNAMDSLQKALGNKIQVILVNSVNMEDSRQAVAAFLNRWKKQFPSFSLPFAVLDKQALALFPHRVVPHYVWIAPGGIVRAITDARVLLPDQLANLLSGKTAPPVKKDIYFNPARPMFSEGNFTDNHNLLYQATFAAGFLDGRGNMVKNWKDSFIRRTTYANQSILNLYQACYRFPTNRVVLHVKDSSRYDPDFDSPVFRSHGAFSYELTTPVAMSEAERKELMLSDLDRFLQVKGRIEEVDIPCWILSSYDPARRKPFQVSTYDSVVYKDVPMQQLMIDLTPTVSFSSIIMRAPVILDETGYSGQISVVLPISALKRPEELQRGLEAAGFTITKALRRISCFVVRER